MAKPFLSLLILPLLLLTACQSKDPEPVTDTSETPLETSEESSTTKWLTYESVNFGFSIEYPQDWKAELDTKSRPYLLLTSPERAETGEGMEGDQMILIDAKIKVYSSAESLPNNKNGLSFEEWIDTEDTYLSGTVTPSTVAGESGYAIDGTSSFNDAELHFLMVEHEGKIYELNFNVPASDEYLEEREHMQASFQFIETTEVSSTNSGTCEDEDCLIEKFAACEAVEFSQDQGFAAITYEIFGPKDGGCEMSLVYPKNPNPDWIDLPMTCVFDNSLDFMTAVGEQLQAAYTGESTCTGPLVEVLES